MKVIYHEDFKESYCSDPAAADGRIEAVIEVIEDRVKFIDAIPADEGDILACHTDNHVAHVRRQGLYDIAALAAGGAIQAAFNGLVKPCFALTRPPGHHASANSSWGLCFFRAWSIK
jgi:acetoin utilization deacetylase AcuC-like enzyme